MPTDWSPLLDGSLRDRALDTVHAIAEALAGEERPPLPHTDPEADPASLSGGGAGLAVFFAYLAEAGLESGAAALAAGFLDKAQETLATVSLSPSLYDGFTGVGWATEHLNQRMFHPHGEDSCEEIDEALHGYVAQSPWADHYDLVMGLVGIGVYAVDRLPRPSATALLELVVERLSESGERGPHGVTWHTAADRLPDFQRQRFPNGYYNLGLAHGVPGAIALLGHACAAGVARPTAEKLLADAVDWLLAQRLPLGLSARFASMMAPGAEAAPARSAWCYGDPGIAAALLIAARATGRVDWEREAVALAHGAADRPFELTRVRDAGFCHGAAGLAHIFNRFYQATGESRFAEAAREWFTRTLDMRQPDSGIAGFLHLAPFEDGTESWVAEPGILTGAAGIGLALLAATTPVEPAWDRLLLLS